MPFTVLSALHASFHPSTSFMWLIILTVLQRRNGDLGKKKEINENVRADR